MPYCVDKRNKKEEILKTEETRWATECYYWKRGNKKAYVTNEVVQHLGLKPDLRYEARWQGGSKADNTTGPIHRILQYFTEP